METESKDEFIEELPVRTQKVLKGIDFPVKRNEIIKQAKESGAISNTLLELGMLPDKKYDSAGDVAEELHKVYMGIPT